MPLNTTFLGLLIRKFICGYSAFTVCFSILLSCCAGCLWRTAKLDSSALSSDAVLSASLTKWNWEKYDTVCGRPAVEIAELRGEAIRLLLPHSEVYRVVVCNRKFVFGSGYLTSTFACISNLGQLKFLENDGDVQSVLSVIAPKTISELFHLIEVFADLRGYQIQVGTPSKTTPWSINVNDAQNPSLISDEEKDPNKWTMVITRRADCWEVDCTLVSIDSFQAYRYRITAPINGNPIFSKQCLIFSVGPPM